MHLRSDVEFRSEIRSFRFVEFVAELCCVEDPHVTLTLTCINNALSYVQSE